MTKIASPQIVNILRSVFSNLPRKIRVTKEGAKVANGKDDVLQLLLHKDGGTAYLHVRFDGTDHISIVYLLADGGCIEVSEEPIQVDHFDHTEVVADFSRKFGWVEDLEGEADKKLTDEQLADIDDVARDIAFLLANAPSTVHYTQPKFHREETDGSTAFFFIVDAGMFDGHPVWVSHYMGATKDGIDNGILREGGRIVCYSMDDGEYKPDVLFIGSKQRNKALVKSDVDNALARNFRMDGPDGSFAIVFRRDDRLPLVPDRIGVSRERADEFYGIIIFQKLMGKSLDEIYEHLTTMCKTPAEVFFVGWMSGSAEMKEYIEHSMGLNLDPLMH